VRGAWASLLLLSSAASAWPVDMAEEVPRGAEQVRRVATVEWAESRDPAIVTAEVLPGNTEVLIVGKAPGATQVLLYAEGQFAVWRITVREPGGRAVVASPEPALTAARKACPGLKASLPAQERSLAVHVKDRACRGALRELLRTDAFLARDLHLVFEVAALQDQLGAVTPALTALGLKARYLGAGLVLDGAVTPAAHRQALWALFDAAVGRVALEDRTTRSP